MEQVMVVDADIILQKFGADANQLLISDEQTFIDVVQNNCTFLGRDVVETDPSYKQIISYCVIMSGDEVFVTRRTKKQTEARLHDRMSVGIGGHVASVDEGPDLVLRGLRRELEEEVDIKGAYTMRYLGVINDNCNDVCSVHTGICYLVRVEGRDCDIKEKEKMVGGWVPFAELDKFYDNFEEWSKIVVNTLRAHPALIKA